jgi:hypothetical protein
MVERNDASGSAAADQSTRSHKEEATPRKVHGIANKVNAPRSKSSTVNIAWLNFILPENFRRLLGA